MIIFGIGNMLSDIYECARAQNKKVTRIVVNVPGQKRESMKYLASRLWDLNEQPLITHLEDFVPAQDEEYFIMPVTPKRSVLVEFLRNVYQLRFTQLIHPTAYISPLAKIGQDVFVGAGSIIGPGCVLKDHVFVNARVTVGHDSVLHEYVELKPGCNVAGGVEILPGATIGLGANVVEELVIGRGAVVAAGAVVIRNVREKSSVAGIPAALKKAPVSNYDVRPAF